MKTVRISSKYYELQNADTIETGQYFESFRKFLEPISQYLNYGIAGFSRFGNLRPRLGRLDFEEIPDLINYFHF